MPDRKFPPPFAGQGQKMSDGRFREKLKIVGEAAIAELGT